MMQYKRAIQRNFIIVLLLLATFLIFLPPYDFAFIGDDYVQFDYIATLVETPAQALQVFNPYFLTWYYRPLQNIWFLLGRLVFGYTPFAYYFLQGLVHLLAVALVWRVGRQLGLRPFPAFLATLLFAIHGHWVDVVGWISSIAIVWAGVWTLAAISAWQAYLKRPSLLPLLLTATFYLLCLVTHEETFLLPLVLLALWWWQPRRSPGSRTPLLFLGGTAVVTLAYLWVQLDRPNITIDLTNRTPGDFMAALAPLPVSQFIADTFARITLLTTYRDWLLANSYLVSYALILLLGLWAWKSGRITRVAILWAISHLAFIYLTLYTNKPELLAGRHFYNSWIGLSLAFGELIQLGLAHLSTAKRRRVKMWQSPFFIRNFSQAQAFILLAVLLIIGAHVNVTRLVQTTWRDKAVEDLEAKAQLQAIVPTLTPDVRIFATRFPITPNFLRSVLQVWYDTPRLTGAFGPIERLQEAGTATPNTYIVDYDDGRVINLAPEIQEAEETLFLWADMGRVEKLGQDDGVLQTMDPPALPLVAGPETDKRLAVGLDVASGEWTSWVTTAVIPTNTTLQFAARATGTEFPAGTTATVRLRLTTGDGRTRIIWEEAIPVSEATSSQWLPVVVDIASLAEEPVVLRLEAQINSADTAVSGTIFWANPRFVRKN